MALVTINSPAAEPASMQLEQPQCGSFYRSISILAGHQGVAERVAAFPAKKQNPPARVISNGLRNSKVPD